MAEGVAFKQQVMINTQVNKPENRFGIAQEHIDRFINRLMALEVDGRKFRTKYQIEMTSGAPQAENFLWTILGNKVGYFKILFMWSKSYLGDQRSWTSVSAHQTNSVALEQVC